MKRWVPIALLSGLFALELQAAPNLRSEISNHKVASELDAMMKEARESELGKRQILNDLPNRLAGEFLVPEVAEGEFSGSNGDYTYTAPVEYTASGNLTGVLNEMATALGGVRAAGSSVCVFNVDGTYRKTNIRPQAVESLLKALGTSAKAIAPTTHYRAEVGDTTVILSESTLGAELFQLVETAITRGGTTRLRLVSTDGSRVSPSEKAAKLVLETAEGQRLKLEVELDGAKDGLANSVPDGAEWRVNGSAVRVPFSSSIGGQMVLLQAMLKNGGIAFRNPEKVINFPSFFGSVKMPTQEIHLLGSDNAWFARSSIDTGGVMEVFHATGECKTNVVLSGKEAKVSIGPLKDTIWSIANRFQTVRPDRVEARLSYLRGPHNATPPSGITNREFDSFMGRGAACDQACGMTSTRTRKAMAMTAVLDPEAGQGMRSFSKERCIEACMISAGYRRCLARSIDVEGASDFLYEAGICEQRRP